MFKYLKKSIRRKIARRVTKEYPVRIETFDIQGYGKIQFANWENPLVERKDINQNYLHFFTRFIKEGDFVIDIGSNIGHMTVPLSVICGKAGLAMAFDPNPYVYKILLRNSELNDQIANIQPFNYAISDTDAEFYYHSTDASFTNGGISSDRISRHGKFSLSQKIKGINLENFLKTNYPDWLPKLKLIKIDTEGYDKEIIRSISSLLREFKPVVISECFGKSTEDERFEHFNLLYSQGYSLFYFSEFSVDAEIVPIVCQEDMLKWKHFDFYAIMGEN